MFVGPLAEMQTHRMTTSIGIFLMGSGTILSSFAKTSTDIFLSVGLISGMYFKEYYFFLLEKYAIINCIINCLFPRIWSRFSYKHSYYTVTKTFQRKTRIGSWNIFYGNGTFRYG